MQRASRAFSDGTLSRRAQQWLDVPVSALGCALGWFAATAVFMGFTRLLGGPTQTDSSQSINATWAIAHGAASCTYPVSKLVPGVAPLYPLVSGGLSALLRIGHRVPFPTSAALGPHCGTAIAAMYGWYTRSGAMVPTVLIGYVGWFVLMAGLIVFLRTTGRGRNRWELAILMLVACLPPVFMPLQEFFHPEDLLAMGLALGGLACFRRGYWYWAGVLLGLAIVSQQFTLLILAPLVVIAPRERRIRLVGAATVTAACVVGPLVAITSGGVLRAMSGSGATPTHGSTVLSEAHLHGPFLLAVSRLLPIVLAMSVAWWTARRFGPKATEPIVLVSLIGVSLTLRLVFEVNLYGYYFMAAALSLVLLDALYGRIRVGLVAWLFLVSLAFLPLPWGYDPWGNGLPIWLWQIVLVPTALALAVGPLFASARSLSGRNRLHPIDLKPFDEMPRFEAPTSGGRPLTIGGGR